MGKALSENTTRNKVRRRVKETLTEHYSSHVHAQIHFVPIVETQSIYINSAGLVLIFCFPLYHIIDV